MQMFVRAQSKNSVELIQFENKFSMRAQMKEERGEEYEIELMLRNDKSGFFCKV